MLFRYNCLLETEFIAKRDDFDWQRCKSPEIGFNPEFDTPQIHPSPIFLFPKRSRPRNVDRADLRVRIVTIDRKRFASLIHARPEAF